VNSAGKRQTGRFTLGVTDGARPVEPKGICRFRTLRQQAEARAVTAAGARQIRVGQTLPGGLTAKDSGYPDTTYYQFWQFAPRPPRPHQPSRPPPVAGSADAQTAHTIAVGQALDGELTTADHFRPRDSTYSQSWNLAGTAGQVVTVDLESTAFDPYLFVAGPGIGASLQDDDSGGNCNARLTLTFPQTGDYVIVVNSATKRRTGPFTLSVTKG